MAMSDFRESIKGQMAEYQENLNEERLAERKVQFGAKMQKLADTYLRLEKERGTEDPIVGLLVTFLDAALEMQTMMESMEAINTAMSCVTEGIKFLDDAINFDQQMIKETTKENYGFFARFKARREMKKAIRNNAGRMLRVVDGLSMKHEMITSMVDAMSKAGVKIKQRSEKMAQKRAKKAAKRPGGAPTGPSAAQRFLDSRRAELGMGGGTGSSAGAAPAASGSSDISDIL